MKKIVLFVFFAMTTCYYGYSQSLTLADSTGPVANNANVTQQGHVNDDEIVSHIFVRNTTNSPIDVQIGRAHV